MAAKAWEDIRPESLMRAWNKLLIMNEVCELETVSPDSEVVESTLTIGSELSLSAADIQTWIESDKDACTDFSDEEIIQLVQNNEEVDTMDSDSEEEVSGIISHKDATEAFEICIKFLEQQPETKACELMLLQQLHRSTALRRVTSLKQTTIKDYFST